MLNDLIYALEAHDTLPSGPALAKALEGSEPLAASLIAMPGAAKLLETWAHERLEGMHQLKCLALEAALRAGAAGQERQQMALSSLTCLRQAIHENPQLSVDAQSLERMSQDGRPLAFTQAARVLREQVPHVVPEDDAELSSACALASWALGHVFDPGV